MAAQRVLTSSSSDFTELKKMSSSEPALDATFFRLIVALLLSEPAFLEVIFGGHCFIMSI